MQLKKKRILIYIECDPVAEADRATFAPTSKPRVVVVATAPKGGQIILVAMIPTPSPTLATVSLDLEELCESDIIMHESYVTHFDYFLPLYLLPNYSRIFT
jgi:hypothetical protein